MPSDLPCGGKVDVHLMSHAKVDVKHKGGAKKMFSAYTLVLFACGRKIGVSKKKKYPHTVHVDKASKQWGPTQVSIYWWPY